MLTSKDVLLKLTDSIYHKIPLSLIRYGDGEAMILNKAHDKKSFDHIFKGQLGYFPSNDVSDEVYLNLVKAYSNCDIIGFPTERHLTHPKYKDGYWGKSKDIFIKNIGPDFEGQQITSIDVHSEFLDNNYYKPLLENRDIVNYISCRNIDDQLKKTFNIKNVNSYVISPEMKFSSLSNPKRHYPDQFNEIKEWVKTIPCTGNICLVGAGIVGKIYCNWFRDQGGVAFDIGSVFDSFAGFATRGPKRGVNVIDNTHKL